MCCQQQKGLKLIFTPLLPSVLRGPNLSRYNADAKTKWERKREVKETRPTSHQLMGKV